MTVSERHGRTIGSARGGRPTGGHEAACRGTARHGGSVRIAVALLAAASLYPFLPVRPAMSVPLSPPPSVTAVPEEPPEDGAGRDADVGRGLGSAIALDRLVRVLVHWVGNRSDHDIEPVLLDPPSVVFARAGGTLVLGSGTLRLAPGVRGVYQPESRVVVLTLPWRAEDPRDRSVLLHELVHAVQLSSREWRCLAEPEWEAHRLQHRWLAEHGIDWTVDWLLVGLLSRCPDEAGSPAPDRPRP